MPLLSPLHRKLVAIPLLVLAVLVLVYAAAGFLVVPRLLERQLPRFSQERFGVLAQWRDVSFNPFLLALSARDLRIAGPEGQFAYADSIAVDARWSALFTRSLRLDEVQIGALELRLIRRPDGSFALPRGGARARPAGQDTQQASVSLPDMRLGRLSVERSTIRFIDRLPDPPAESDVTWLGFELRDLATDTDSAGRARLTAVLPEGGAIAWTGRLGLQPIMAEGDIRLLDLRPIAIWKHLRSQFALAAPAGQLDFAAHYRFAYEDGRPQLQLSGVQLDGSGLTIASSGSDAGADGRAAPDAAQPALELARLGVHDASFDLARRELVLPRVRLQTGSLRLTVDESGVLNWQRMFAPSAADARGAGESTDGTQVDDDAAQSIWRMRVESLVLEDMGLAYIDRSRAQPLEIAAEQASGAASLALAFGGAAPQLTTDDLRLDLAVLSVGAVSGAPPALRSTGVALRDGRVDLAAHEVTMPEVHLGPGSLRFAVDRTGRLNWSALFAREAPAPRPSAEPSAPWTIRFPGLQAAGLATEYRDESRRQPMLATLSKLAGSLDLTIAAGAPSPVSLADMQLEGRSLSLGPTAPKAPRVLTLAGVKLAKGALHGRQLALTGLHLREGAVRVDRAEDGSTTWGEMMAAREAARPSAPPRAEPWRIELPGARVQSLAVRYRDRGRASSLAIDTPALSAGANLTITTGSPVRADAIAVNAAKLEIGRLGDARKAIAVNSLAVRDARLQAGILDLGAMELAGGHLQLTRVEDGSTDLQRLFVDRAPQRPAPTATAPEAAADALARRASQVAEAASPREPWHVRSPSLRLRDFDLSVTDRTRARPVRVSARSTSASASFDFVAGRRFAVNGLDLRSGPLTVTDEEGRAITGVDSLRVDDGRVSSAQRIIGADAVVLRGGDLVLERTEAGRFALLDTLGPAQAAPVELPATAGGKSAPAQAASGQTAQGQAAASAGDAWRYRLGRIVVEDLDMRYVDRGFSPPLAFDLPLRRAALTHLDPGSERPAAFEADIGVGNAGRAQLTGTLTQDMRRADATFAADAVDVKALQPVLGQRLALEIESGELSAKSALQLVRPADGPARVSADGRLAVDRLSIKESATGERFIAWKRLTAQPVMYNSAPNRIGIGEVFVLAPAAKLEIAEGGGLNLKNILKPADRQAGASASAATPPQGATPGGQGGQTQPTTTPQAARPPQPSLVVRVDRVRVRDGVLRYADQSLMLPFDVRIEDLDGTMIDVSNVPGEPAELRAEGHIEPFALAKASGRIDLFSPRRFTDIRAQFLNVEMPKLSPYTVTFAGRAIASGKLWLDLNYDIENGQLLGENEVTVRNLKLGDRVEAARARDLPLDLAARLLTDQEGVISVSVPLRGDLNKPGFDYRGIIRKAIATTFRRLATAPFRLIGRLFGLGSARVDRIAFEPGSDVLRPPEQEKLQEIADALSEQPALQAELQPGVSREDDLQAMRTEQVRRDLARRVGVPLAPAEDPGPTAFGQAATQRALEDMLQARAGAEALDALSSAYRSRTGGTLQRVSRGGPDIGPGSPDADFYEAVFERLVALQPLQAEALTALARRRAGSISNYLARATEIGRERIRVTRITQTRPDRDSELIESEMRLRERGSRS